MLYMYLFQRRLIYYPERDLQHPEYYGFKGPEIIEITTEDGHTLHGWYTPAQPGRPTIVYFHGNRGHLGNCGRPEKLKAFVEAGFGVITPSWRGYGTSSGKPDEIGLMTDADAAMKFAMRKGLKEKDIIIYGESLGSGMAVRMGTLYPARLLVLEAPYTSVQDRGVEKYPWLPVRLLLIDKFDSLSIIPHIKPPVLIMHGELDAVIPPIHGQKLFDAAPASSKKLQRLAGVHHSDFDPKKIIEEMELALQEFPEPVGVLAASAERL